MKQYILIALVIVCAIASGYANSEIFALKPRWARVIISTIVVAITVIAVIIIA
jgi:hypothetical protein